jgi:methionyl-tRNA formyltransferase
LPQLSKVNPRIVLAGSVSSSALTLEALIRNGANVVGAAGLAESKSAHVSGYTRLDDIAASAKIPYFDFREINTEDVYRTIEGWTPDLLFVVGLSQMVRPRLLNLPSIGCIGFHPTWLPKGRGRAPLAWLVLDGVPGAATFFLMDEGADSGPILVQEPFFVDPTDYAEDVERRILDAIGRALDQWIPKLNGGEWQPQPQDHTVATYNGRRGPDDALIKWDRPAQEIHSLIRTASKPHPGAHTYVAGHRLLIWRAEPVGDRTYRGVVGRILDVNPAGHLLVQTGDGLIWLTEYEISDPEGVHPRLAPGVKLGYEPQDEIHRLYRIIATLQQEVSELRRDRAGIEEYSADRQLVSSSSKGASD